MDASENTALRSSRISRLPGPATHSGLSELSDAQHNTRSQSAIPAPGGARGLKREIPQPAVVPDPKRKPLAARAVEYPSKAPVTRSAVKGQTLASISQIKPPSRQGKPAAASSLNSFAKSFGPGRNAPPERPASKLGNRITRSKTPAPPRPKTAHGHRNEEIYEQPPAANGWDVDDRVGDMETQFKELKEMVNSSLTQKKDHDDSLELAKTRISELESDKSKLESRNETLRSELDMARENERNSRNQLEDLRLQTRREMDEAHRKHERELDDISRAHRTAVDDLARELDQLKEQQFKEHQQQIDELNRKYQQEATDERQKRDSEIQELRSRMTNEQQDMELRLKRKDRDMLEVYQESDGLRTEVDRQKSLNGSLQTNITALSASNTTLEAKINSLKSQVEFLQCDSKAQSDSFASMEVKLAEALEQAEIAKQKVIKEETERRVLFNKYQELKGNIRVMCRVRPALGIVEGEAAGITFPDEKTSAEILLAGPEEKSSLGVLSRKNHPFEFDRVFHPGTQNEEVFGEISQLVQSALDGYNVCIFCYGQTGSGKTHTMSSEDGMIPRATHMIYDTIHKLREKSWTYTMEGSFVEVYNEDLNDLLTPNDGKGKKLEIRHDDTRKQTFITNCKTVRLDSPDSVETMLEQAQKNRSVAATKANERSSRSHSIFILKLVGENSATGERCEGTLNLVDLAGSERLKHSQAEGDRMRETQNINKSLSCLGDVIEALGKGSGHIPYRNSKLTHLLQYSLGGNSKTLMFVMVSPLETHVKETLTSLRFATKVYNTHVGTAKATKKIREQ